ncbi:uncharacterized protein PgNI_01064 [Pyricularia grisea]|uniref:Uncharacterized protein n=1 Tax=Pyricularia grisea TaxID=148305 RepID=A0A6P8BGS9_PYRGI|nr:uncharacterized protein PgNI_01064 [Pyricularia grisea]TLD15824.1 hypothetical protein PgNI_01064 [Pyricularia grisea]
MTFKVQPSRISRVRRFATYRDPNRPYLGRMRNTLSFPDFRGTARQRLEAVLRVSLVHHFPILMRQTSCFH